MPLYEYSCVCGHTCTDFRHVDQRRTDAPVHCGRRMDLVIGAPAVQADLPGYLSHATGRWVEGRAARRDDLARSNCRPWEGMEQERKEATKRKREADAKADKKLEEAVRRTYAELPPSKRRVLEGDAR